jgi:hypothetical protein
MDMKIFRIGQLNRAVVNKLIAAWRIAPICAIVATLFAFMLGIVLITNLYRIRSSRNVLSVCCAPR